MDSVRALLVVLVLAGGCHGRATRERRNETMPSASARAFAALQSAAAASAPALPESALPPPPVVDDEKPAPRAPVKLIRAPRLSAPRGVATVPLFECAHVAFAWGHEFRGFVVDEKGRVWLYDRGGWAWTPEWALGPDPTLPPDADSRWFTRASLTAKMKPALSTARLELASVRERGTLIAPARLGELPPPDPDKIPLDFGDGEYCFAYRWDEARTAYQVVDLLRNSSPAAESLSRWLHDIEQALMQSPFNAIPSELALIALEANEAIIRKANEARASRGVRASTTKEHVGSSSRSWHRDPGF